MSLAVPASIRTRQAAQGQLSRGWQWVFALSWAAVVLAIAAVWKTSRVVGLSTWWLGPPAEPRLLLVELIPGTIALVVLVAGFRNVRHLPWIGIGGALALAGVALGDAGRFHGLALVEAAIALAALLLSTSAFAGVLHPITTPSSAEPPPRDGDDP